mgnify:CR=1 FL=1
MGYFKINLDSIVAGLTHQKGNLVALIRYCHYHNLKLVKPQFTLCSQHNNGTKLKTDLSEYYDLNSITVNGKPYTLYDDQLNIPWTVTKKKYKWGLLVKDEMFGNYLGEGEFIAKGVTVRKDTANVHIPYTIKLHCLAQKISSSLGDYMCVHVRRGDRVITPQIDADTQAEHIKEVIGLHKPDKVYIMTNRLSEISQLDEASNVFFYTHYPVLKSITDNYYLFCVENIIMDSATIRCSTFKTNTNKYHCYLTDHPGWQ